MPTQPSGSTHLPYHLRASRLRWGAFAVTLDDDEQEWVERLIEDSATLPRTKVLAQLLLSLHGREDLSKLCLDLHFSRRKLLDLRDKLTTKEGRRLLLSQPVPVRGRPKKRPVE